MGGSAFGPSTPVLRTSAGAGSAAGAAGGACLSRAAIRVVLKAEAATLPSSTAIFMPAAEGRPRLGRLVIVVIPIVIVVVVVVPVVIPIVVVVIIPIVVIVMVVIPPVVIVVPVV